MIYLYLHFVIASCVETDPLLSQVEVGCLHVRLDTGSSRHINFSSISNLHQPPVAGSRESIVNEENLTTGQIRATIDLEVDGQLEWNLTVPDGENVQMFNRHQHL